MFSEQDCIVFASEDEELATERPVDVARDADDRGSGRQVVHRPQLVGAARDRRDLDAVDLKRLAWLDDTPGRTSQTLWLKR